MAYGVHGKRREAASKGTKALAVHQRGKEQKIKKKSRAASIKNQMRSIQRLLKKNLSADMKDAQQKHLEDLKQQAGQNQRTELERKMSLRYRRVKFFERRKIERAIKRIEKLHEAGPDSSESALMPQKLDTSKQLEQLKEDLEYVRFFPKIEKYVSLFMGHDDEEVVAKRSELREKIKANLAAAAAKGVEPEEMDIDEDQAMEMSDDDFFLAGSSSDDADADADDQWPQVDHTASKARRHTSDPKKNHQQHQRPQNPPSSRAQFQNQRPQSTGRVFKNKAPQFRDESRQFQIKKKNEDKRQTTTANTSTYSRSEPARDTLKTASSTLSSKNSNAGPSNGHPSFRKNPDIAANKPLSIPEVDTSIVDAQKKRRRKHRPKKKRT